MRRWMSTSPHNAQREESTLAALAELALVWPAAVGPYLSHLERSWER